MSSFADALRALNRIKAEGVVDDYAIAGAMALLLWAEPVPTYHLDVLAFLPDSGTPLVSLDPIYRWAGANGYPVSEEHLIIEGVPTQIVPSPSPLADEAIQSAATLDYEGDLAPGAGTRKRRERAAALLELPDLNRALLDEILSRHGIEKPPVGRSAGHLEARQVGVARPPHCASPP